MYADLFKMKLKVNMGKTQAATYPEDFGPSGGLLGGTSGSGMAK